MRLVVSLFTMMIALSLDAELVVATDSQIEQDAKPSMGNRLISQTVTGKLVKIEGADYWIQVADSQVMRVHVDGSTKGEKVAEGDKVKASVNDERHATTLQRDK